MSPDQLIAALPARLGEVFALLVKGRHISAADDEHYYDLQQNFETYKILMDRLGYPLQQDPRGFFYVEREGSAADMVDQIAVFVWILVDWMGDRGESVTGEITSRQFEWSALPHLQNDRYREYMERVGVDSEDRLRNVLRKMDTQFGYIRPVTSDYAVFKFLAPVHRILDVALQLRGEAATAPEAPAAQEDES